jgi:hypothetical protein
MCQGSKQNSTALRITVYPRTQLGMLFCSIIYHLRGGLGQGTPGSIIALAEHVQGNLIYDDLRVFWVRLSESDVFCLGTIVPHTGQSCSRCTECHCWLVYFSAL